MQSIEQDCLVGEIMMFAVLKVKKCKRKLCPIYHLWGDYRLIKLKVLEN